MSKPVKNVRWHIGCGAVPCLRKKTGCLGGGPPGQPENFQEFHYENIFYTSKMLNLEQSVGQMI